MIRPSRVARLCLLAPLVVGAAAGAAVPGRAPAPAPVAAGGPVDPASVAVDTAPWLYKGSDIAQDKDWRFGRLPNGLRYAVRHNGVPPGQVALRVRIEAGSLNENEGERGFAHFIEHLTFRGSEYVPDGEAKRTWQRFGATFGTDQNAFTTPTETVYHLDLPGASVASVDESLKIMSGMMERPNIVPAALSAERPVVLAEQREQPGPQVRFGDTQRQTFFAGQPLADRSPIGNIKTLEAATADAVLAFHDRWYRPENAVVIVVGDMDADVLAKLVTKHFASWRGIGPVPRAPDFGRPRAGLPVTATTVEPAIPEVVSSAVLRPWRFHDDTVIFNQRRLVDTIATQVIDRRLETRARAGGSFLQASVDIQDVSRSANVTSINVVPLGDGWELALKDVRGVIADAMARPASQAEIDQELAGYDAAMRTQADTAAVQMGTHLADDMVQALDIRETTTSPRASYDVFLDARRKRMFTPAAVLASTRRLFKGDADRAVVNLHAADPAAAPKLAAALKADAGDAGGAARVAQAAVSFAALPPLGAPGTVTSQVALPGLDVQQLAFANGVRLLVFPSTSETSRVYVRVRWGGGYNQLPAGGPSPAWAGELALVASGIGPLKQGDLDALTAGRRIGLDFDVGDDAFSLAAITSPADLADQLKLMADKLAVPGWDPAPVVRAKGVVLTSYAGFDASPDGVLSRDLEGLLHGGDPRWATPAPAVVQATSPEDFRKLWEPILRSGPIEVSVFGDVTIDAAVKAVAATFGALPPRDAVLPPAPPVRFPAHVATPVVRAHGGNENQAAAVIAWPTGGGVEGIAESRRLDVLAQIFSDRLFERLRQAAGASYSPSVQSSWPVGMTSGGRMVAIGQVVPEKVPFFLETARAIAAELVAKPIEADELRRIMLPMAQSLERASTSSQFWMRLMAGAAYDPARATATANVGRDFGSITPAQLQQVAAKYLRPDRDWTMEVLPRDVAAKLAGGTPATGSGG